MHLTRAIVIEGILSHITYPISHIPTTWTLASSRPCGYGLSWALALMDLLWEREGGGVGWGLDGVRWGLMGFEVGRGD